MKMEKGKIPYNSMIRSVLRAPFERRETDEVARDGASASVDERVGISMNTTVYGGQDAETLAFARAVNSALAAGITPERLMIGMTLPTGVKETEIASRMQCFQALVKTCGMKIAGGHTTCSDNVTVPVFTLTVTGRFAEYPGSAKGLPERFKKAVKPGDVLIMTGFAGDTGAMLLYREKADRLYERFTKDYLSVTEDAAAHLLACRESSILREHGAQLHDVSEGGILGALWEFSEGYRVGFEVDEKAIPIHQETIEICEYLGGNPYALLSTGCMLAAVPEETAGEALEALAEAGIPAARIGEVVSGRGKNLRRADELRCLERPQRDFIMTLAEFG